MDLINFPLDKPNWKNTKEGSTTVKLAVLKSFESSDDFELLPPSAAVIDYCMDTLFWDDKHHPKYHILDGIEENASFFDMEEAIYNEWISFHYPNHLDEEVCRKYTSRAYKAALVVGSAKWVGVNKETGKYWKASYEDLTNEGKQLYNMLKNIYENHEVHILTFVDWNE